MKLSALKRPLQSLTEQLKEDDMVEFMVMKVVDGKWDGLGRQSFRIAPRTGEFVIFDEGGIGQAYQVKAVMHPMTPAGTAGDLILTYVGTELDLRKSFQ